MIDHFRRALGMLKPKGPADANIRWQDVERFEVDWRDRISTMALHIPPNSIVMDFGCGPMWLKQYLVGGKYIGIDYVSRGPETIVCDLNAGQFPDGMVDVAFVSGCLEYVNDPAWFIGQVARHCNICIISYCTIENFSQLSERRKNAWMNDMSQVQLIKLFAENRMALTSNQITLSCNSIFVFSHACKVS